MKTSLPNLLEHCTTQGIQLSLDGGSQLAIDAPAGTITPELLAQLKAHKPELLAFLKTGEIILDAQTVTVSDVRLALDLVNTPKEFA